MTYYENIEGDLSRIADGFDGWSAFSGKTVLVTGANGHIAGWIALAFVYMKRRRGLDVKIVLLSRNREKMEALYGDVADSVAFVAADVADAVPAMFAGCEPDYIFHFAGNASPHAIKHDPVGILHANIDGTEAMARLAAGRPGCRLLFASSREVYGEVKGVEMLSEDDYGRVPTLEPRSCYPESKRAAEALLEAYRVQYGVDFSVVRIAHCYGPGMKTKGDGRVMQDLLGYALEGEDIVLNSDGSALRAFCYVADVVGAVLLVAAKGEPGEAYNVSNEREEISIKDLAELICSLKGGIKTVCRIGDADRSLYCSYKRIGLDTSRIEALGWRPAVSLKEGLSRIIKG